MTRLLLLLAVLGGCGPAEAIIQDTDLSVADLESDTDTDADADADADTDSDIDTDGPADGANWTGSRDFDFRFGRGCEDTLNEVGYDVTDDSRHRQAVEACPSCEQVFLLNVSPDSMCDGEVGVAVETYRGVAWTGAGAKIFLIGDNGQEWYVQLLDEALGPADSMTYEYDGQYRGEYFSVQGTVRID